MQCVKPFLVKVEGEIFEVPCGNCVACKITRAREWTLRILHEMSYHRGSVFLTLTYADEHLPPNETLQKNEFQKFVKRLRKALGVARIKYFACGEYGEESERPHYHAIILGWKPDIKETVYHGPNSVSSNFIEKLWKYGNNTVGSVTRESIGYTVGYIAKKFNGDMADELYAQKGREPPFQLVSQGMGKKFAFDNLHLCEQLYVTLNGKKMALPRYYKKLYGIDKMVLKSAGMERAHENYLKYVSRGDYLEEKRKSEAQRELNINASAKKRNKI